MAAGMDSTDKDLGWEDVGHGGAPGAGGGSIPMSGEVSGAVASAFVNHFAKEFTTNSLSLWPQFVQTVRRYFNVNHGYVLRKMLWQLVPNPSVKKKSSEGELGAEKDWTVRVFNGLELDIEEPDLYIPTMGFVTYVVLCGVVRGLQDTFTPEVISATISFAVVALVLETTIVKAALFMSGAVNTPTADLVALLGYKFFYLSLHIALGLILGRGWKPSGFFYNLLILGLAVSCGVALWQALRRLARMQPSHGQECMTDMHQMCIKALPFFQAFVCWCLLPTWPQASPPLQAAVAVEQVVIAVTTTVAAVADNSSAS
eukprot:TRINITY_DN64517_c0_g1_i1.p1 TRINITY_DN64517_c0_g1~~TRINITY_DN64517_c0_g1_i1.p1  ORF type:complete len:315 (-),score=64.02 TRINITY_DN64517_c0_g1_i1:77-1021(-)